MTAMTAMTDERIIETGKAVDNYLRRLEVRGLSVPTLIGYRTALAKLEAVAEWLPCTEDDVIRALLVGEMGANTRAHTLRTFHRFFEFTESRHPGVGDPTADIEDLTQTKPEPRVLTDAELYSLVAAAERSGERDLLLVLLILDTGIRVGEVSSMIAASIRDRWLHVDGKRGKRRVPITPSLAQRLVAHAEDGLIWRGRGSLPMKVDAIKKAYVNLYDEAGIDGTRRGPHTLRHTYATRFIEEGGGVVTLKEILGHASIMMTYRYVSLAGKHILDAHGEFSPAVRMGLIEGVAPPGPRGEQTRHSEQFSAELLGSYRKEWASDYR